MIDLDSGPVLGRVGSRPSSCLFFVLLATLLPPVNFLWLLPWNCVIQRLITKCYMKLTNVIEPSQTHCLSLVYFSFCLEFVQDFYHFDMNQLRTLRHVLLNSKDSINGFFKVKSNILGYSLNLEQLALKFDLAYVFAPFSSGTGRFSPWIWSSWPQSLLWFVIPRENDIKIWKCSHTNQWQSVIWNWLMWSSPARPIACLSFTLVFV